MMAPKYHSYLLRLWTSGNNAESTWHISLESSETGEKRFFANLDDLVHFFENLTGAPSALQVDAEGEQRQ
jgi:hypothetical protein